MSATNPRAHRAPFPYFGGKSSIVDEVWARFGRPKQYIEPFCGSAAVLLSAAEPASLEVIGDQNCYVANFWRSLKFQPDAVCEQQDYPVSHIDLYARHRWLTEPARVAELREALLDPEWPGDARIAGWWLWGQCAWIGSGWCDSTRGPNDKPANDQFGKIPHIGNAGIGVHKVSLGKVPHTGDAGRGVQAVSLGQVPHTGNAGRGVQAVSLEGLGQKPFLSSAGMGIQSPHAGPRDWLLSLAARLARVRIIHGDWSRCLNHHYGATETAVFLDPPYKSFERLYAKDCSRPVADDVADWARDNAGIRVALCGHRGDYDLPGWEVLEWDRGRLTYGGNETTDEEAIWFSPSCLKGSRQMGLFGEGSK